VKNKKALQLLFTANGISGFAQGISMLAIPWYFTQTNHAAYFNTAYGITTIVVLFFGLYAGTLVDKYSRKHNFLGNSLVCGVLLFAIALLGYWQQQLADFLVVAVFAITMLNYNIHYPTLYAFGQEISDAKDYAKVNANIEVVGQSTSILSGGVAALLLEGIDWHIGTYSLNIKAWHIWEIFMLNAVTYFMAAVLITFIKYQPTAAAQHHPGLAERIKVGFNYLKAHPRLLLFGLFSYSVFAMLLVEIHAVLPVYVNKNLQSGGGVFAIADGIYAVGALGAGLFVNKVFHSTHPSKAVILLTFLTAIIFFWASATGSVWIIYTISLILGFTNAGIRVLRLTWLFQSIPNEIMGRVNSIFNMANILIRSLFIFLFSIPFFTFDNNIIWAYFIMAMFLVISALMLVINHPKQAKS